MTVRMESSALLGKKAADEEAAAARKKREEEEAARRDPDAIKISASISPSPCPHRVLTLPSLTADTGGSLVAWRPSQEQSTAGRLRWRSLIAG